MIIDGGRQTKKSIDRPLSEVTDEPTQELTESYAFKTCDKLAVGLSSGEDKSLPTP